MLTRLLQKIIVLMLLIRLCLNSWAQKEIDIKSFELSGMPYLVRCREMHVALIQKTGWKQRLQLEKGMKLNMVYAYLLWNRYKKQPNQFTCARRS